MVIDPHKWLFAPFDCAALLYRQPALARVTHTQNAGYLDVLRDEGDPRETGWDPADYAHHLTRRARGLALWFSLAVYGLADGVGFVVPSKHLGRPVLRLAFLHPDTTTEIVNEILERL